MIEDKAERKLELTKDVQLLELSLDQPRSIDVLGTRTSGKSKKYKIQITENKKLQLQK